MKNFEVVKRNSKIFLQNMFLSVYGKISYYCGNTFFNPNHGQKEMEKRQFGDDGKNNIHLGVGQKEIPIELAGIKMNKNN